MQPLWSNSAGKCVLSEAAAPPPPPPALHTAAQPVRILDTRAAVSAANPRTTALGPGEVYSGPVLGNPLLGQLSNLVSVVVNVTVTPAGQNSYLTLFEADAGRSGTSCINFGTGQTIANMAVVTVGADRKIAIYNSVGAVDVIADLAGYYS